MTEQPTILYIEDNEAAQELVQRVLGAHGYAVVAAENGLRGIALARELRPVLILVDVSISGMDGYETTTRLRSMDHLRKTPIVVLSGDISPGARERALVAGCDGYLAKPLNSHHLPEQIAEFIAGKREILAPALEREMLRRYNQQIVERLEQRVRDLMAANIELQEGDRLKTQFLTTLSHELRTPLTSLLGYLDLFSRGTFGSINDVQRDAIVVMQRNVETLSSQLNNLLYLQEYRTHPPALTPVDLHNMIDHSLKRLGTQAINYGIAIKVNTCVLTAPLRADPSALEQVVHNLIDNAIKYTAPCDRKQVIISTYDEGSYVFLRIEDTGIGIVPDMLEKIFLPFFRIDNSLAGPQPGSGIGLALVKHVVEAHGGQVTVRSVVGQGSTFTVTLPRR